MRDKTLSAINIFFFFTVGLSPFFYLTYFYILYPDPLLRAELDFGLGIGIAYLFLLSLVLWIPSTFLTVIFYRLVRSIQKCNGGESKVTSRTIGFQIWSMGSVVPLFYFVFVTVANNVRYYSTTNFDPSISFEIKDEYITTNKDIFPDATYHYTLLINNKGSRPYFYVLFKAVPDGSKYKVLVYQDRHSIPGIAWVIPPGKSKYRFKNDLIIDFENNFDENDYVNYINTGNTVKVTYWKYGQTSNHIEYQYNKLDWVGNKNLNIPEKQTSYHNSNIDWLKVFLEEKQKREEIRNQRMQK